MPTRRKQPTTNLEAFEATLAELQKLGRIETLDAAQVQLVRSLAVAVDNDPLASGLWRQYREALADLLRADDDADQELAQAIEALRSAT
jgi:hypothetical protein